MNVTLAIDDRVVKAVRKVAIDQNTTMTAMIRSYLERIALQDEQDRGRALSALRKAFVASPFASGGRHPSRDELHER